MGLFDKKECAICGGKVKGLFPASFGDKYVCDDCLGEVHIHDDVRSKMTVEDFLKYREFRDENQKLKAAFRATNTYNFGLFLNKLFVDAENNMLCLNSDLSTTIFEAKDVDYFTITEDGAPLYEGKKTGLIQYESAITEHAHALTPLIHQIRCHEQCRGEDDGCQNMTVDPPFEKFYITIYLKHPYWPSVEIKYDGPYFDSSDIDIRRYIKEYHEKAKEMADLAQVLMGLVEAGANARGEEFTAATTEIPETDVIAEIKKYKELFDLGAITEEEFAAKKKQLMGI